MRTLIAIVTSACGIAGPVGYGWFHHAPREVVVERTRIERVAACDPAPVVYRDVCEPAQVEYREVVRRCPPVTRVVIDRPCPPPRPRCRETRVFRFEFCRR